MVLAENKICIGHRGLIIAPAEELDTKLRMLNPATTVFWTF